MAEKELSMREKIESVLNDESLPTYRIAKECGIWVNSITRLRNGEAKIGNIRFEVAEALIAFYDRLHEEK